MPSFEEIQKAKIAASFNSDEGLSEITKAEILDIEKGGKRALIGEKRTFGGREYVKTSDGWKFHGKGTGAKAQSHAAGAIERHVGEKKESEETGSTLADYGAHLDRSKVTKEDVEEFDNSLSESDRSLIDSKMKEYRSQGGAFHSPGDILDFKKKALKGKSKSTHKNATDSVAEIGSTVKIVNHRDLPTSLFGLGSQNLKVVGYEKGTLSVPKFLVVEDKNKERHSINPNYTEKTEEKSSEDEKELFSEGSKFKWGGKYKSYTFEVIVDLGDDMKIINRTKGYRADPYIRSKEEFKGAKLIKEE